MAVLSAIGKLEMAQRMLEIVTLCGYQVMHSSLDAEASWIITLLMAGAGLSRHVQYFQRNNRSVFLGDHIVFVIYSHLLPMLIFSSVSLPNFIFPIFALLAGNLSGMIFSLALAFLPENHERGAGFLYYVHSKYCYGVTALAQFFATMRAGDPARLYWFSTISTGVIIHHHKLIFTDQCGRAKNEQRHDNQRDQYHTQHHQTTSKKIKSIPQEATTAAPEAHHGQTISKAGAPKPKEG